MGDDVSKKLLGEYDAEAARYDSFGKSIADLIERLLQTKKIEHLPIEHRTKDRVSLAEKIVRPEKAGKYNQLSDITDIAGVRVIAFLHEDCEKICQLIEDNFTVDHANSSRKADLLDPDRFGYISNHYVVSHMGERLDWPEFTDFSGMRAEIQVRTVLQHSWAAIDWKLRYKSRAEVPAALRRRLHRISALLEAADSEFSAISASAETIRAEYKSLIDRNVYDIPIDAESISIYVRDSKWLNKLIARAVRNKLYVVRINGETHGRLASLIYALEDGEFRSLADVDDLIRNNQGVHIENLKSIFSDWSASSDRPMLSVETMIRILATVSRPRDIALKMINAAPLNVSLGDALRKHIAGQAGEK